MNTHSKVIFVLRTELEETETESKSRRNLCLLKNTERDGDPRFRRPYGSRRRVLLLSRSLFFQEAQALRNQEVECCFSLGVGFVSLSLNPLPNPNFLLLYRLFLTILLLFIVVLVFCNVDIVVDNCAICRNHIMDLCKHVISVLLLL